MSRLFPTIILENEGAISRKTPAPTIAIDNIFKNQTQFKVFPVKDQCIEYIKNNPQLKMFSEDKTIKGNKRFYALSEGAVHELSKKKKYSLYENYEHEEMIKFCMDIDLKTTDLPKNAKKDELLDDIIGRSIELIKNQLSKYNVIDPQIIILTANTEQKLSAHIYFIDVVFKNIDAMKFFMETINSKLIMNKTIDMRIYRVGCFRLLWNTKLYKNNFLVYYKSINYDYIDDEKLFMDCLIKNIPEKYQLVDYDAPKNLKLVNKKQEYKGQSNLKGLDVVFEKEPIAKLEKYLNLLNDKRADDYIEWLYVGMSLHNCNSGKDSFELWDKWSKKSEYYGGRNLNIYKWNSFKQGNLSLGSLRYWAKEDSPEEYDTIQTSIDKPLFETIKFCENFLMDKKYNIKHKKNIVCQKIDDWMNSYEDKVLAIWSTYETGKSKIVKKILLEYKPQKILFVSYRQSLSYELHGLYHKLGVTNYLNGCFASDKIICQIESLHKLIIGDYLFINEEQIINEYDLIIIDEVESVAYHAKSSTIVEKEKTFNLLRALCHNAKKILMMDGDFSNRSYEFAKEFCDKNKEPIILQNEIKKNKRHFVFSNDRMAFEKNIDDDLKAGLKIVLVNMSSKLATYFYKKYQEQYKCVLHCSHSDDTLKAQLKDVNNFWLNYDLVVYSPSIEAGVNFSKEYFDKQYVVLSSKSTSPRALVQMLSRVRKLKSTTVHIYTNNLPFREKANFFTFDEIKEHVCDIYKLYLEPKITLNNDNKMIYRYEYNLYAKILIYNEMENANKTPNYFIPYLISLLTSKGHTYEYNNIKINKNNIKKETILNEDILKADDITNSQFNLLMLKQMLNNATHEEKIKIEKHLYKLNWKIDQVDENFLNQFGGKTYVLQNLRLLLGKNEINPYVVVDDFKYNELSIEYDNAQKKEQIKMLKEIINKLGYKEIDDGTKIEKDIFEKKIKEVITSCELFTKQARSYHLFNYNRKNVNSIKTIKQFLGFINSIFIDYGLLIKIFCINKKIKEDGKWKNNKKQTYTLKYVKNINKYV